MRGWGFPRRRHLAPRVYIARRAFFVFRIGGECFALWCLPARDRFWRFHRLFFVLCRLRGLSRAHLINECYFQLYFLLRFNTSFVFIRRSFQLPQTYFLPISPLIPYITKDLPLLTSQKMANSLYFCLDSLKMGSV